MSQVSNDLNGRKTVGPKNRYRAMASRSHCDTLLIRQQPTFGYSELRQSDLSEPWFQDSAKQISIRLRRPVVDRLRVSCDTNG